MWVVKNEEWHKSHTDLTKYFIEKLKQRVDFEETISNRHRTTNGFTLIHEIIEVSNLAQKRIKSVNRLVSLVKESTSTIISSSIYNDYILNKYHPDIIKYYTDFNTVKLKESNKLLSELHNKSKIYAYRLSENYYKNIIFELKQIDFASSHFNRHAVVIDNLVECLIPYLLHQGYSTTSISDIAYRYVNKAHAKTSPNRIINNFDNNTKEYCFLIVAKTGKEEINAILNYLSSRSVAYSQVTKKEISKQLLTGFKLADDETIYLIKHSTLDPHNYLRNIYELGLKNHVAVKNRISLQFFTHFFDSVYWSFNNISNHKFQKSNIAIDPINVPKRKSTLFETLETIKKSYNIEFNSDDGIPYIHEIRDSLYYYNLALGSKSIENSLSLLWTSLESLLPYRLKDNDIENIQYFVSKSLSTGAIGREITSFATRCIKTNWINDYSLNELGIPLSYLNYNTDGITRWIEWISADYCEKNDPYQKLKANSNLLCKNFCALNEIYTGSSGHTVEYWLNKIKNSETSIKYQLDRIYLHRNQIVHSGKFINEYSNLWNHLEWYVGKLLSYCVISFIKDQEAFDKEKIFMRLEADVDMLTNLLENNKTKKINEIPFAYPLVAKDSWQFF